MNEKTKNSAITTKMSSELSGLIYDVKKFASEEAQCKTITPLYFVTCAIGRNDALMYNVVSSLVKKDAFISMVMELNDAISTSIYTAMRPNVKPKIDVSLSKLLELSDSERKKVGADYVTSDHVLLSLLDNADIDDKAYKIVSKYVKYDDLLDASKQMLYMTKALKDTETDEDAERLLYSPEKFQKYMDCFGNGGKKYTGVQFCKNLNGLASLGKVRKVIGREDIISIIEKTLSRKTCNNVFLVGKTGVGKTTIVEGLSRMIFEGSAPLSMLGKVVYSLKVADLIAGSSMHGIVEDRILKLTAEIKKGGSSILFIDDVHMLADIQRNSDISIFPTLMDSIQGSGVEIIMASTPEGYTKVSNQLKGFKNKFQKIDVEPMNVDETINVIKNIKDEYESFHEVVYTDEIVTECVKKCSRFITDVALPASALDILDSAGSLRKLDVRNSPELSRLVAALGSMCIWKNRKRTTPPDEEEERNVSNEIESLRNKIEDITSNKKIKKEDTIVTVNDVNKAISERTGVPVEKVGTSERKTLSEINDKLKKTVIGQDEAIDSICNAIKRNKIGLYRKNRPIYTAFLLGPTGVGKTLTAKMLAREVFGDDKYLVKFDMSEYADKTSVNKLIGAGAGYVGYDDGGLLTEAVKNKKYAVVLFDEIEKADDLIYNLLLQVLDEATLTDNMGNKVDFSNTIVLLTSNVGARAAQENKGIGFTVDTSVTKRDVMEKELKKRFPPEFINRVDDIIYYNELVESDIDRIIRNNLDDLCARVKEMGYSMEYNDSLVDFIYNKWTDEHEYGARPILRIIEKYVEGGITDSIIENDYETHDFKITADQEHVLIS